ncbi:sickle tail protein homolog isoform X8 [Ahaetulla prasina]|uniref:sickle tail protein homolog isoform X8 n=1 Tax=Ahaetulla prasina TaxID=499056 RepID=UPI0026475980|nr:sickle tail protein homolog isoform X8 [Ahaetulla prasina]
MQPSDMDKKREAFLEHLKQKYPHHASAIMGHQERLRDQALQCMLVSLHSELDIQRYLMKIETSQRTRSPKLSQSPQPSLGDQAEYLSEVSVDSLEVMSEAEALSPFARGSRTRASLPVVRSTNQTKERSLGVLYLQYGDETKQLRMPNEITSTDTIRALFVSAFPQQLTMKMLESPSVAIYIKDESRNIYYELSDVRNIQDKSFLKVYNKDPAHVFNHKPRAINGDVRMQREIFPNTSRPGSISHPPHALPTSPPPMAVPHSMPTSPSRIPYSVRPVSGPGNATIPRDRLSNIPGPRSISPSPSAILERRDVKPDEDMGNKTLTLFRNEGLYADPYLFHEGRMSIASSHTGHSLDVPDHIIAYHRSTMRSSGTYCTPPVQAELVEQSLYRQKSRKYPESLLPTLSSKTPPASPHRVADIRMIDIHTHQVSPHTIHLDRSSPGRQSLKKDPGTPVFVEGKARNAPGLSGMAEVAPVIPDKKVFGYGAAVIPKENETRERMQAMEKQIASLTGLVQSALLKGPNTSNSKDPSSEKMVKIVTSKSSAEKAGSTHDFPGKNSLAEVEISSKSPRHSLPSNSAAMQFSLLNMKRNVSDLRLQLLQIRQLQLQNQDTLKAMMRNAELEINHKVIERAKRLEDPVQRHRHLVEQDRQKYLLETERIMKSLWHVTDSLLKGVDPSQAAQYHAMEKATAAEVLKNQEETANSQHLKQTVAECPAEMSVKSEMIPISTVTVHHAQSSPVVTHQSQHSFTLVSQVPNSPLTNSPGPATTTSSSPTYMESATMTAVNTQQIQVPHSPPVTVNNNMQSLFIEELHNASTRNRALSIEKAEKKWEEKRQNLDHYDGQEFEKLLEEAQANIMKSIPNLDIPSQATVSPKADAAQVSEDSTKTEQELEKAVKSPPPPPPRRSYVLGSGLSTRLSEVSYTARKDNTISKESSEDSVQAASSKLFPEKNVSLQSASTPMKDEEEEEEEGDKIMAELQAFQKCSYMDINSNNHAEQSRNDTHIKDARSVALTHPKEKKVDGEATKDSDHPKDKTEGRTEVMISGSFSIPENSAFRPELLLENKDYANKNSFKPNTNFSSLLENEGKRCPEEIQDLAAEIGRQKPSYVVVREKDHSTSPKDLLEDAKVPLVGQADSCTQEMSLVSPATQEQGRSVSAYNQVALKHKASKNITLNDIDEVESPASIPDEESSQSENVGFMITRTAVQFLSGGEVHDIVNRKGNAIQTVNIDSKKETPSQQSMLETLKGEEPVVCLDKKPVIIIFDEPMDIRSAYKRLSTIFEECDEELEKMMTEEKIEEENEEFDTPDDAHYEDATETNRMQVTEKSKQQTSSNSATQVLQSEGQEMDKKEHQKSSYIYESEPKLDVPDAKKKFKFKFPKKQLAALTQAIRTGTKTGKKTLQVVVYEEEEEDGTVKQHKEAKRFEIPSSQSINISEKSESKTVVQASRTEEIRKNTYRTLDSLEQTIKQLESTISEMSPKSVFETTGQTERPPGPSFFSPKESIVVEESNADVEFLPSIRSSSRKNSTNTSQTSRMPIPVATKSRQGGVDKTVKQHKLQDQRQYRQANGSAKKAGGDYKAISPILSASKIPAFSSTSGKSSSVSSGDSTNLPSLSTKASVPSNSLSPPTGRPTHSSSLIPSVANGSLKFQNPTHTGKGHSHLLLSTQTQNGRPTPLPPSSFSSASSSSSLPSSISTTLPNQSMKNIRSIHTPSFTSYKSQNGSVSKANPSSTITKESS